MARCFPLLLLLCLAPACAPEEVKGEGEKGGKEVRTKNLVLLTDTTQWETTALRAYRDSLEAENYRVLISGYPGESAAELTARLPWLLQPGVDVFIYDPRLAGPDADDSIKSYLEYLNHPVVVQNFKGGTN